MWDRFDICEAWFLFASHHHQGQFSAIYTIFGRLHRMRFTPRPMLTFNRLSPNGQEIYARLEQQHQDGTLHIRDE